MADPLGETQPDSWKSWPYQLMQKSSLRGGSSVLRDNLLETQHKDQMEVTRLSKAITVLSDQFTPYYKKDPKPFVLDVEWKIYGPERTLWIKQGRPLSYKN